MNKVFAVTAALALLYLGGIAQANVFNMGPGLTNLGMVRVGDPGNAADTRVMNDGTSGYGAVSYVYDIGKYEVTAAQYCDFLNHKAKTDTHGLWNSNMVDTTTQWVWGCNIQRSGASGRYSYSVGSGSSGDVAAWGNRPVNWVSYWDACRFANWLNNGQGDGDTEDGAYTLGGFNGGDGRDIQRNVGWKWAVTSEDEWYKAAYYKSGSTNAGYWDYPTQTNTTPSPVGADGYADPGNHANYFSGYDYTIGSPYWRTNVGEFENSASAYGTFDQGGNIDEWNETLVYNNAVLSWHGVRGGDFAMNDSLYASSRGSAATGGYFWIGFRLSRTAPEPVLHIVIDIRPGTDQNNINLRSRGVVTVAILSADEFDASSVDPAACRFAGAAPLRWAMQDVNRDGDEDLILHFDTQQLNLSADAVTATLTGETRNGQAVEGTDNVRIVPPAR